MPTSREISYSPLQLNRIRVLGVLLVLGGLGLLVYGVFALVGIYRHEQGLIIMETGISPEKGRFWVNCITGASLMAIGGALRLKARELSRKEKDKTQDY